MNKLESKEINSANSIKSHINQFYRKYVADMVNQLLLAEPGKRIWTEYIGNTENYIYDYRETKRSTYPDWSKFFFEKSIYNRDKSMLLEKKYGGTGKELINILEKSLTNKRLTKRQGNGIEIAFENFQDYIYEYENFYGEKYFNEDHLIGLYDDDGTFIGFEVVE